MTVVGSLGVIDIIVVVLFFSAVIAVGLWSSCRNRGSVGGYFLAGRSMHWIPVGASLFASNIGSGHFIGLAGSGAAGGIGIAVFEFSAMLVLVLLGWVFVPVYISSGVFTMPEYLKKRFGGQRIRIYLSCLTLILYIFTKVSADLYAGAVFIEQSLQFDLYVAVIILLGIAALFTILGGLTAVIWTDFIQTIIMVIGAFWLMIAGFIEVGGYEEMVRLFPIRLAKDILTSNTSCGVIPETSMNLMKPIDDDQLPWLGATMGLAVNAIWYWCSDQDVCDKESGCTDLAYPTLVLQLLGDGPRGLMMAVMISSLVSSLTSIFNSASTIFTIDIWKRIRSHAPDMELMIVGRVFVLGMVAVGVAWIPIVKSGAELFHYIQAVTSYLSPPVCAVYMAAVLWKRCNEKGAFWGLIVGFVVGMIRFIVEYSYEKFSCHEAYKSTLPDVIGKMHYLHFGILLFVISLIVIVVVSLLTEPIPDVHLHRLTFWDRYSELERVDMPEDEVRCACRGEAEEADIDKSPDNNGKDNQGFYGSKKSLQKEEQPGTAGDVEFAATAPPPWYVRAGKWVCGIEDEVEDPAAHIDPEELKRLEKEAVSLDEDPKMKRVVDINAFIIVTVCLFYYVTSDFHSSTLFAATRHGQQRRQSVGIQVASGEDNSNVAQMIGQAVRCGEHRGVAEGQATAQRHFGVRDRQHDGLGEVAKHREGELPRRLQPQAICDGRQEGVGAFGEAFTGWLHAVNAELRLQVAAGHRDAAAEAAAADGHLQVR
uniref:Sodium/glucose cotransporter 4 n=1 Tax=Macrostomum lignano TaxID=282301 RepID=A0A1I8J4G9_9PLAT